MSDFLCVGTFDCDTFTQSYGVYVLPFDARTGKLSAAVEVQNPGFNASSIVAAPSGRFLYVSNDRLVEGGVCAYQTNRDGTLKFLNKLEFPGAGAASLAISNDGRYVLAPLYGGSQVVCCRVGENGGVEEMVQHILLEGHGIHERQEKPHPHHILFNPAGTHVIVPDLGSNRIWVYAFDSAQGLLSACGSDEVDPGEGPRHASFHPQNPWLYVLTEMGNTVYFYLFDEQTGALTRKQKLSLLPETFNGECIAAEIKVSPDGRYLLCSTRGYYASDGTDRIFSIPIDKETGYLGTPASYSSKGICPRVFEFSPNGNFVLISNQFSHEVIAVRYDSLTGGLGEVCGKAKVVHPSGLASFSLLERNH